MECYVWIFVFVLSAENSPLGLFILSMHLLGERGLRGGLWRRKGYLASAISRLEAPDKRGQEEGAGGKWVDGR